MEVVVVVFVVVEFVVGCTWWLKVSVEEEMW